MKSICSEFKRHRIIVAVTTSMIEKYSLANLRKQESFTLTEHNRSDLSKDIRKAVTFLHAKGLCHGKLKQDYVIIDEVCIIYHVYPGTMLQVQVWLASPSVTSHL